MSETSRVITFDGTEPTRLDHFLVTAFPEHSRSYLQGLIKKGYVSVNQEVIQKTGFKLEKTAEIGITFPPLEPSHLVPEDIPLDIIFEDQNILVVNKPAGMVVHPAPGHSSGTLVHAVLAHSPDIQGIGGVKRPGVVHRLDQDTSGVILLAKNDQSHRYLQSLFKKREIRKTYLALVDSMPPTKTGRIEAAIGRDSTNRQRMAVVPDTKGKMAISEYQVLETFEENALLKVNILTGRTHQIRLHLAFMQCPVVGDQVYGRKKITLPVERQLLHAYQLEFIPPGFNEIKTFTAKIPEDFRTALGTLNYQGEIL